MDAEMNVDMDLEMMQLSELPLQTGSDNLKVDEPELSGYPISDNDIERALIALGINWEKKNNNSYGFRYHGHDAIVEMFPEGIEVVYRSQSKIQDEDYMMALKTILSLNGQIRSGYFTIDLETKRVEHRFVIRCCREDSISTVSIMFALCVGYYALDVNHKRIFDSDSDYVASDKKEEVMYR
jgi:hypothetical protein